MSEVRSNRFIGAAVHALRMHRCGDTYPEAGWPEVDAALAEYAKHRRMTDRMYRQFRRANKRRRRE